MVVVAAARFRPANQQIATGANGWRHSDTGWPAGDEVRTTRRNWKRGRGKGWRKNVYLQFWELKWSRWFGLRSATIAKRHPSRSSTHTASLVAAALDFI